jgi:hypothetical protein
LFLPAVLLLLDDNDIDFPQLLQSFAVGQSAILPILAVEVEERHLLQGLILVQIGQVEQQTCHHRDEIDKSLVLLPVLIRVQGGKPRVPEYEDRQENQDLH